MPVRFFHYLMVAPVQLLLIGIIGIPALAVFWHGLTTFSYGQEAVFVGFDNYVRILTDRAFWRAGVNTFIIVNAIVYLELAAAIGIAVLFAGGIPARRVMIAIVLAPYAVSEVVAVVMWRYMLEPDVGMVTQLLEALGLPTLNWPIDRWHALAVITILSIWLHLPFTSMILYSARLSIPLELYEAARVDGASAVQRFLHVTLPMLVPAILIALLFRYVFAFRIFGEVWLLTRGGPAGSTEVLATYLYRHAFRYLELGTASAIGWLMLVATLLISMVYLRQVYKRMLT